MDELKHRFRVARWIAEEVAGLIGDEERRELELWRKESPAHEQEYQELRKECRAGSYRSPYPPEEVDRQWERFTKNRKYSRRVIRNWYRYAAVLVLLLGGSVILEWQWERKTQERPLVRQKISMAQGNPLLVLSNGTTVNLNDSLLLLPEKELEQVRLEDHRIAYDVREETGAEEIFNTLIIPKGGEFQVRLADGSQVWLNSETELRYPVRFRETERRVFLKGEAYFEVAENAGKPFIVTTSADIDVKVLGTKFNVAAYEEDEEVITTLAEGSVEVGNRERSVKLKPAEQALFHKTARLLQVQKVEVERYISWKDGKFMFEEQSLEQIMKQLQRWYEMSVFYTDEEVKQYTFSGDLKKYDDFGKIVRMIEEVAGIKINIKGNCVVIGTK